MNNRITFIALSFLTLFWQSCFVTHGDHTYSSSIIPNDQKPCEKMASHVYLFYEGEEIDFNYTKLGEVEANGGEFASNQEVMDYLMLEAWANCANGLIHIKSGRTQRTRGYLLDSDSDLDRTYSSKHYTAVAVNIEMDRAFVTKYGLKQDTTFVNRAVTAQVEEIRKSSNELVGSFIFGIATVIIYVLVKASETK